MELRDGKESGRSAALRKIFNGRTEGAENKASGDFNQNNWRRNDDFAGGGAYLAVGDQRDGAMVAWFVRVVMNPFVQGGARRHCIKKQNHPHQQGGERRLAKLTNLAVLESQTVCNLAVAGAIAIGF